MKYFLKKKRFLGRIIIIKKVRSDLMNNYDLWKWVAGKRTDKNKYDTYSKKNWLYVLLMLGLYIGIMLLHYLISLVWK
jgi:hypothetical protein